MAYRTYYCQGLGFYAEKQGRIIAASWTDEPDLAKSIPTGYVLTPEQFRNRMEVEGFHEEDDETYF